MKTVRIALVDTKAEAAQLIAAHPQLDIANMVESEYSAYVPLQDSNGTLSLHDVAWFLLKTAPPKALVGITAAAVSGAEVITLDDPS